MLDMQTDSPGEGHNLIGFDQHTFDRHRTTKFQRDKGLR